MIVLQKRPGVGLEIVSLPMFGIRMDTDGRDADCSDALVPTEIHRGFDEKPHCRNLHSGRDVKFWLTANNVLWIARDMPNRRRFRIQGTAGLSVPCGQVASPQERMQVSPGEVEFVEAHTDSAGLDPIEKSARRGTKTAAERALQAQRILPHRSTVTPQMQVIHERRFNAWKQGLSCEAIADLEDVAPFAVERSVNYMLSLLPDAQVLRVRNLHVAINSHKERGRKYALAMERLLGSDNSRDLDRGMTHFERAVGLAGGGVNVTVDNRRQTAILSTGNPPLSFEEVMDRVRTRLLAERRATTASGPTIEAEPIEE